MKITTLITSSASFLFLILIPQASAKSACWKKGMACKKEGSAYYLNNSHTQRATQYVGTENGKTYSGEVIEQKQDNGKWRVVEVSHETTEGPYNPYISNEYVTHYGAHAEREGALAKRLSERGPVARSRTLWDSSSRLPDLSGTPRPSF